MFANSRSVMEVKSPTVFDRSGSTCCTPFTVFVNSGSLLNKVRFRVNDVLAVQAASTAAKAAAITVVGERPRSSHSSLMVAHSVMPSENSR